MVDSIQGLRSFDERLRPSCLMRLHGGLEADSTH